MQKSSLAEAFQAIMSKKIEGDNDDNMSEDDARSTENSKTIDPSRVEDDDEVAKGASYTPNTDTMLIKYKKKARDIE